MADVTLAVDPNKVASNSFNSVVGQKRNTTNTLGKDDFLKLLTTQMKYQDPMSPASSTDFIAQLAQFSSLEGMTNLEESFSGVQSYALLGRNVIHTNPTDGSTTEGVVTSVKFADGAYSLSIFANGATFDAPLEQVKQVNLYASTATTTTQ